MIVPLAAMHYFIKSQKIENKSNYDKIDKWYWISVFSNRYDQAVDTTTPEDFKAIKEWISTNDTPEFVQKFDPSEIDLEVDKQSNAVYRGIINLIILKGALDFKTGQAPQFDREKVQDDHIFPKSIYKEHRIGNRTLISTNQSKIDKKPSEYFSERLKELCEDKVNLILQSHLIPPEAVTCLLNDDLENFLKLRNSGIINEIREKIK